MTKITRRIKQFITKSYNIEKDNYCWYNTQVKLSPEDLYDLVNYFNKSNYNFMLIINGCSQLRPQRTWGSLPTFLKGIDGCHLIFKSLSNSFILCSWLEDYEDYKKDMEKLIRLTRNFNDGKIVLIGIYKAYNIEDEEVLEINNFLKKLSETYQLEFIDISDVINHSNYFLQNESYYMNYKGHKDIANKIINNLNL